MNKYRNARRPKISVAARAGVQMVAILLKTMLRTKSWRSLGIRPSSSPWRRLAEKWIAATCWLSGVWDFTKWISIYVYRFVCVYIYIEIRIYIYIYMYVCIHIYKYKYTYIHAYIHTYIHTYIYIYTYMYISIYIYT